MDVDNPVLKGFDDRRAKHNHEPRQNNELNVKALELLVDRFVEPARSGKFLYSTTKVGIPALFALVSAKACGREEMTAPVRSFLIFPNYGVNNRLKICAVSRDKDCRSYQLNQLLYFHRYTLRSHTGALRSESARSGHCQRHCCRLPSQADTHIERVVHVS